MAEDAGPQLGGPYLTAALLCERVIREDDGTLSAFRLIDRVAVAPIPPEIPEPYRGYQVNLHGLVACKAGNFRGALTVKVILRDPGSATVIEGESPSPLPLDGPRTGFAAHFVLNLRLEQLGLYWMDALLNGQLASRIPLEVILQEPALGTM